MISRSSFFENSKEWYQDPLATPNDRLLCAFVNLRLITAETLELLQPRQRPDILQDSQLYRTESLLKILNRDIDQWISHWYEICSQSRLNAARNPSFFRSIS